MNHPAENRDLEQQAVEALEDFRQGIADAEQIKLLAWLTCIDGLILQRIAKGKGKFE